MGRANRRSLLGEQIAEILGTANGSGKNRTNIRAAATKSLICGGVALLVVAPTQVEAIGLGEMSVQSNLGRPLQAVVPMRVGAGESLPANCVKPGASRGELTKPADLRVKSPAVTEPGTYNLRISTPNSLHEPMYELSLVINCPGTPVLVRHYVLMLDLPGALASVPAVDAAKPPATESLLPQVSSAVVQNVQPVSTTNDSSGARSYEAQVAVQPDPSRSLKNSVVPIQAGTLYRVRQGDTLSTVAARIDGRLPNTTWAVAERLFATNPDAFIRNNPDLIKLGSLVRIPGATELASISPASPARLTQQPTPVQPTPEPVPLPSVQAPIVTEPRAETVRSDASLGIPPQAELVLESDLVPVEVTSDVYQEINTAEPVSEPVSEPVTNAEAEAISAAAATPELEEFTDTAVSNPFADEDPANVAVNTDAKPQVTQAPEESVSVSPNDTISPWLAIGIGLLLGLAVSLLILRRRLVTAVVSLLPRRDKAHAFATKMPKSRSAGLAGPLPANGGVEADEFDTLAADAAFDTGAAEVGQATPLKIGDPLEKTYIVETGHAEPTQKVDAALDPVALSPAETSDDEMLAELFGESPLEMTYTAMQDTLEKIPADASNEAGAAMLEPTAQLPKAHEEEIFAEIPADASDTDGAGILTPTVQQPRAPEEEIFDASGELAQHLASSDVIDPTAEMPFDPTADVGQTLMQAFTEELDKIEPEIFDRSAQIDGAAEATEAEQINSPATEEASLEALPKSSEEDDILSETLYDALTLLEHDYEDEFTASQILERSAIKKSLETLDDAKEDDDEALERKLTS